MADRDELELLPAKPTPAMIDAAVAFALNVKLCGEYGWSKYMEDLYATMRQAAPDHIPDATKMMEPAPHAMTDALKWYAENVAGCRKLTKEGNTARNNLDADGGKRAVDALLAQQPAASDVRDAEADSCGFVLVRNSAVDWLKEKFPALCIKSGLCEQVGKRLYTVTRRQSAPAVQADEGAKR